MDSDSRHPLHGPLTLHFLRAAALIVISAWAVLGVARTTRALSSLPPAGGGGSGVVGTPLPLSPHVRAVRSLLPDLARTSSEPEDWLVVLPPDAPDLLRTYLQYQLAHLDYPRRFAVVGAGAPSSTGVWDGIIAGPGVALPGPWRPVEERGGYRRWEPEGS